MEERNEEIIFPQQSYEIRLKVPAQFYDSIRQTALDRGDTISSFVRNAVADKISALQANKAASAVPMMMQLFSKGLLDSIAAEMKTKE
jgi:hypothetical protein